MLVSIGLMGSLFSLVFISIILQIVALVSIVQSSMESTEKLTWTLITIFVPFGWLVYFIVGRKPQPPEEY